MRERIEQISFLLAAIVAVLLSVADMLGLLDAIPRLATNIPSISLAVLGLVLGYLVFERRGKLDEINKSVSGLGKLDEIYKSITDLNHRFAQVNLFFAAFKKRDHFSEIALIYELRGDGQLISENTMCVDSSQVLNLWRDCIAGSRHWQTVTYVRQEFTWDTGWGNAIARGIQLERISVGGNITRVFVLDDMPEYERMLRIMKTHEKIRVEVKWLLVSELLDNQLIKEHIDDLGSLDISIVDDTWILLVFLDNERHYTKAMITKDHELVEKAAMVFTEAFEAGRPINELPPKRHLRARSPQNAAPAQRSLSFTSGTRRAKTRVR